MGGFIGGFMEICFGGFVGRVMAGSVCPSLSHSLALCLSHTHIRTRTLSLCHTRTHTHTHSFSPSRSQSYTHTHTHSIAHSLSLTHTQTHTLFFSLSLTLSPRGGRPRRARCRFATLPQPPLVWGLGVIFVFQSTLGYIRRWVGSFKGRLSPRETSPHRALEVGVKCLSPSPNPEGWVATRSHAQPYGLGCRICSKWR